MKRDIITIGIVAAILCHLAIASAQVPVTSVTANRHDGMDIPQNTLDRDASTQWTATGNGAMIEYQLGIVDDLPYYIWSVAVTWRDDAPAYFRIDGTYDGSRWGTYYRGIKTAQNQIYDLDGSYLRAFRIVSEDHAIQIADIEVRGINWFLEEYPLYFFDYNAASSYQDGNPPHHTADYDLNTRWSAEGQGQWVEYYLEGSPSVECMAIAWYRGDRRKSYFAIEALSRNGDWIPLYDGTSSGKTNLLEVYQFPSTASFYFRIVGYGNTQNQWNSITMTDFPGDCGGDRQASLNGLSSSSHQSPNTPGSVLDGDLNTRWSAEGKGQWIQFNVYTYPLPTISGMAIAWYHGDRRKSMYRIEASYNEIDWYHVTSGKSSGKSSELETITFTHPIMAPYYRIVGGGNSENRWNSITEVRLFGGR